MFVSIAIFDCQPLLPLLSSLHVFTTSISKQRFLFFHDPMVLKVGVQAILNWYTVYLIRLHLIKPVLGTFPQLNNSFSIGNNSWCLPNSTWLKTEDLGCILSTNFLLNRSVPCPLASKKTQGIEATTMKNDAANEPATQLLKAQFEINTCVKSMGSSIGNVPTLC